MRHYGLNENMMFDKDDKDMLGYFVADVLDSQPGRPVFNRVCTLRDSWAKIEKQAMQGQN